MSSSTLPGKEQSDEKFCLSVNLEEWQYLRDRHEKQAGEAGYTLRRDPLNADKKIYIGVMNDSITGDPVYFALGFQHETPCLNSKGLHYSPRVYLMTSDGCGIKVVLNARQVWSNFDRSLMMSGNLECVELLSNNLKEIKVLRKSASGKSIIGLPIWN